MFKMLHKLDIETINGNQRLKMIKHCINNLKLKDEMMIENQIENSIEFLIHPQFPLSIFNVKVYLKFKNVN